MSAMKTQADIWVAYTSLLGLFYIAQHSDAGPIFVRDVIRNNPALVKTTMDKAKAPLESASQQTLDWLRDESLVR